MTFNNTDHPRGQGQRFVDKAHSAPEGGLESQYAWAPQYEEGVASTDASRLAELSTHPERAVRAAVASNRHTSSHALNDLSSDPDYGVRIDVADNPSTPSAAIRNLIAFDPNATIRSAALDNLNTRPTWHPSTSQTLPQGS